MYSGPSFSDQVGYAWENASLVGLGALLVFGALASISGLALLVVAILRARRRAPGAIPALAVLAIEVVSCVTAPPLAYLALDHYLEMFGAESQAVLTVYWMWCPWSFLLGMTTLVNLALAVRARRRSAPNENER